jgi:DNA repair exonuclease SbcCD nuclease subunit
LQATFRRAIDFAISENVVAVLIAGDLLEDTRLSMATERFLLEQLQRLDDAQIPCIYVAGHSDAADPTSRTHEIPWPVSFLHIKEHVPKVIELQDVDGAPIARVVGAGHESRKEEENLAMHFPRAEGNVPHIGLLHTAVQSFGGEAVFDVAPSHIRELKASGYVYWALGHQHECRQLDAKANIWYAGNLVGSHADETGAKGGLLVTIDRQQVLDVSFKAFSGVRWYSLALNELQDAHDANDFCLLAEQAFAELQDGNESISLQLLRIHLSGMCPMADELQIESRRLAIEEQLAQHLNVDDVELRVGYVTRPVDVDAYRDEAHLLSEVLKVIETLSENPELLDDLVPEPLAAQPKSAEERKAYLSSLLGALDREAIVRLTDEKYHAH